MKFVACASPRVANRSALALVSLLAIAHASPAWAQSECGPPDENGTVTCEATEEPYTGITYEGGVDTNVVLKEGVAVDLSLSEDPGFGVTVTGEGTISLFAEDGTVINGGFQPAVYVGSGTGAANVRVDQVFGDGIGIDAVAFGDLSVAANYVEAGSGIAAYSEMGNIAIETAIVAGVGYEATGIFASTAGPGNIAIVAGETYGIGDIGTGIYAETTTGSIDVTSFFTYAEGEFALGIGAVSTEGGSVSLNLDTVTANGLGSTGILAAAIFGDVTVNAWGVYVDGAEGNGIIAGSDAGRVTINVENVSTQGELNRAIQAETAGSISITSANSVGTSGNSATAVHAVSSSDVTVDLSRVYTYGESSHGVEVTAGSATINAASLEIGGESSAALIAGASEDIDVTIGNAYTLGTNPDMFAIGLSSEAGDISLTIQEGVHAEAGRAITTLAIMDRVDIAIEEGAHVYGGTTAIQSASTNGTFIEIAGSIASGTGPVIEILDNGFGVEGIADVRITSSGTLQGHLFFSGGNDLVDNAGHFLTVGESIFGAGNDRLVNRGTLGIMDGDAASITFTGLERLENNGLITLANDRTGDTLTMAGTLQGGAGAALELDLDTETGESDFIAVGALTNTHSLNLNLLGRGSLLDLNGIYLVSSEQEQTGAEITLDPATASRGFIALGLDYDGQGNWLLSADLSDAAYLGGAMAAGVRDLWHFGAEALSTHLQATRNGTEGGGAWIQALGGDLTSETRLSHSQGGRTLRWDGSHEGVQLGVEKSFGDWQVGFTGGYGSARISLGENENSRFGVLNAGVYASYAVNGWFAGAMVRADMVDVESDWTSVGLEDSGKGTSLGVSLEGGYHADLGGIWFEPALRLAWVNVSLPDQEGLAGDIEWEDGSALRGEIGFRLGADAGWLGLPVQPFLATALAREFGGGDETLIDIGAEDVRVKAEGGRTYGRIGGGLAYHAGNINLYTQVDGRLGDIEGVSGVVGARFRF